MRLFILPYFLFFNCLSIKAQQNLTPELLWKIKRVSALGLSKDKKYVVYNVSTPSVDNNKSSSQKYVVSLFDGRSFPVNNIDSLVEDINVSPDSKFQLSD